MSTTGIIVNLFPADFPMTRIEELLADYRQRLTSRRPDDPPDWYCAAAIDQLEALLADWQVAA